MAGFQAEVFLERSRHPCRAHDLSRHGVLLVGAIPRPDTDQVRVVIRAATGPLQLAVEARVARYESDSAGEDARLGLSFDRLDDGDRDRLEALLARLAEVQTAAPLENLRPGATPTEIRKALEAMAVPQRIALATHAGPREREFLRLDSHPTVLDSLARNPNLLVTEARAIASTVHVLSATLEFLAHDPRWSKDPELVLIVASHPHAPLPLAERLALALGVAQMKRLVQRPSLNPLLRDKLLKRIARGA